MTIYKKLMNVQKELHAPKGQRNTFGKYNFRSCEDILAAVKPLLAENGLAIFISDTINLIGDRYYVEAIATVVDIETGDTIQASASARETEDKKGMDQSQVTGATSSYARKYALNGLFGIDNTDDADTMDNRSNGQKQSDSKKAPRTSNKPKESTQSSARSQCTGQANKAPENSNKRMLDQKLDWGKRYPDKTFGELYKMMHRGEDNYFSWIHENGPEHIKEKCNDAIAEIVELQKQKLRNMED